MLNKLRRMIRQYDLIQPRDTVICAVSGGADSMALLWGLYLLKDELQIRLEAAHFNHHLRGAESDRDQKFVEDFCRSFEIALHLGGAQVQTGKKGLEAAAREARYSFFHSLCGKIATAHTADDNAETVLLHLIRGTGLKGLGAIAPVNGAVIRPLLQTTRREVLDFLEAYHLEHIEDSSNETDQFLRNRVRQQMMPLLAAENPRIAENLSAMALRLREDEAALQLQAESLKTRDVAQLRSMPSALRARILEQFLKESGVREPEAEHIALCEALVFSEKPSASANFPGGVTVGRQYQLLTAQGGPENLQERVLPCPGRLYLPEAALWVLCESCSAEENSPSSFTVRPEGEIVIRSRQAGDWIRLPGGSKSVKKKWIDDKIPAAQRGLIPVAADRQGLLGVCGLGASLDRLTGGPDCVRIRFEPEQQKEVLHPGI